MNSNAAATMTRRRPQTSASRPARNAPTAQPGSSALTVMPSHASLKPKVLLQSFLRAVDDAAVVAEHEAADGGDADDGGDQAAG